MRACWSAGPPARRSAGAFEWRPNIWITGGAGTGKSTINGKGKIFHQLFGGAMVRTAEASSAAIRQMLRNSTVPVLFDEIEASEDNRRVNEIVNLARVSSSGDNVHRGAAGRQFVGQHGGAHLDQCQRGRFQRFDEAGRQADGEHGQRLAQRFPHFRQHGVDGAQTHHLGLCSTSDGFQEARSAFREFAISNLPHTACCIRPLNLTTGLCKVDDA